MEQQPVYSVSFEAMQAYRDGLSQHDNPYPKNTIERVQWGLAMHRMELEEFHSLIGGSHQCQ